MLAIHWRYYKTYDMTFKPSQGHLLHFLKPLNYVRDFVKHQAINLLKSMHMFLIVVRFLYYALPVNNGH